jgi:hypothetical protein
LEQNRLVLFWGPHIRSFASSAEEN